MKNVVLLGSTGSIGTSTAKVAEDLPEDIRLVGLAAGGNDALLAEQAKQFKPELISISSPGKAEGLRSQLDGIRVASGEEGLIELATLPSADIVLIAIVGTAGLQPALAAIRAGKDIAVASKEILVMAGEIVMAEARKHGVNVLPVDSEHSAIFQCLDGRPPDSVRRLILTASGGEGFPQVIQYNWQTGAKLRVVAKWEPLRKRPTALSFHAPTSTMAVGFLDGDVCVYRFNPNGGKRELHCYPLTNLHVPQPGGYGGASYQTAVASVQHHGDDATAAR